MSLTSGNVFRSLIYNCSISGRRANHSSALNSFRVVVDERSGSVAVIDACVGSAESGNAVSELTCASAFMVEQVCFGLHRLRGESSPMSDICPSSRLQDC